MWKEILTICGAIAGLLVALLAIIDRILSLRNRLRCPKQKRQGALAPKSLSGKSSPRVFLEIPYLFLQEIMIIVSAGLLLNCVGLALSVRFKSILYLDMTGTALTAFLLGPWWGAIVGLLSNSLVNWLLYPEPGAEFIIFPWSLVNMAGGFFWGLLARTDSFKTYFHSYSASLKSHIWFLIGFGVLGGCVMSIPGMCIQAALGVKTVLSLNPEVASAIDHLLVNLQYRLLPLLKPVIGADLGESLAWAIPCWLQTWFRYIPDKTISAAVALVVVRYAFPLFEHELIGGGSTRIRPIDNWSGPLILGFLYVPSFVVLLSTAIYHSQRFWPLWSTPWLIIAGGFVIMWLWGPGGSTVRKARLSRRNSYLRALRPIKRQPIYEFFRRFTFATLLASAFFVILLPILSITTENFYRVAFNFFCIVYAFLLATHLGRIAICQNLAIARIDHHSTAPSHEAKNSFDSGGSEAPPTK